MRGKQMGHVCGVDIQAGAASHHAGGLAPVAVRDAKAPPLVVHKPVKGNPPLRAKVEQQLRAVIQLRNNGGTPFPVDVLRDAQPPVVAGVLLVAPVQGRQVQVSHIPEGPSGQEVVLHETDQTLHFALRKGVPGLAEFGLETHSPHELLVVALPDGLAVLAPPDHHALHVVREDILRDPHVLEGVNHANEQVFLLGVGEELHIPLTTMVADHGEAGGGVFFSQVGLNLGKAPVHLERLAGGCSVSPPPVSLRSNRITDRRDEMLVGQDVVLNRGLASGIPVYTEPAQAHGRVCHSGFQQAVQDARIAAQEGRACLLALGCVLGTLEVMLLHPAEPGTRNPGAALQLWEVDSLQGELVSLLRHHLLNDLGHRWKHGGKVRFFHLVSFHRGLAMPSV